MSELRTIEEQAGQPAFSVLSDETGINMIGSIIHLAESLEITKISVYWGVKEGSAIGCHCIWNADTFELITRSDFISVSNAPGWIESTIEPITLETGKYIVGVWGSAHSNIDFPIFGQTGEHLLKENPNSMNSFADASTGRGMLGLILEDRPIQMPVMARMLATTQFEAPITYAVGAAGGYIWVRAPGLGWRKGKLHIKTPGGGGWKQAVGLFIKTPGGGGWRSSI